MVSAWIKSLPKGRPNFAQLNDELLCDGWYNYVLLEADISVCEIHWWTWSHWGEFHHIFRRWFCSLSFREIHSPRCFPFWIVFSSFSSSEKPVSGLSQILESAHGVDEKMTQSNGSPIEEHETRQVTMHWGRHTQMSDEETCEFSTVTKSEWREGRLVAL